MAKIYKNLSISYRFVGFDKKIIAELKNKVCNNRITMGKYFKDQSKLVVCIELIESENNKKWVNFIKNKLSDEIIYGLYSSVVTENDNGGITLPKYALDIYNKLGGMIDFSFIVV